MLCSILQATQWVLHQEKALTAPETPVISSVTAMDKYTAVVAVKPQENCTYEFSRSDAADGTYKVVSTSAEPLLYDENQDKKTDWYYRVRAVRGNFRSELSEPQKNRLQRGNRFRRACFDVPRVCHHLGP